MLCEASITADRMTDYGKDYGKSLGYGWTPYLRKFVATCRSMRFLVDGGTALS